MVPADLVIPGNANAIILFVHAGADSRHNRLNRMVAEKLQQAGFGTLLPDLLGEDDLAGAREFDTGLLTARLNAVTAWVKDRDLFGNYRLGYYATTTAAASALQAAADPDTLIGAIVCRGGRTDLVRDALPEVKPPVLLIVGSQDRYVLQQNHEAMDILPGIKKLSIIQGATHFFDNEKIDEVGSLALAWFHTHLEKAKDKTGAGKVTEKVVP